MKKNIIRTISFITIFVLFAWLATSCGKVSSLTGVSYDSESGKISWSKDDAVNNWTVLVNGEEVSKGSDTEYTIDPATVDQGSNTDITITGTDANGKEVAKGTETIAMLPNVAIELKDGFYDWSASLNELEKYNTETVSVQYKIVLDSVDKGKISESKYKIDAGAHTIMVKPVLNGSDWYYSSYSKCESKELSKPVNVNLSGTKFVWNEVDFFGTTAEYLVNTEIYVTDSEDVITRDITTHVNYFDIKNVYEDFNKISEIKVTVKAKSATEGIIESEVSETFTFKQLDQVKNVHFENNAVRWDEVEGATKYEVELDGKVVGEVEENSYAFGGNDSHRFRVRAKSDATISYSSWSESITINTLAKPSPTFSEQLIVWSSVTNAANYAVKLYREIDATPEELDDPDVVNGKKIIKIKDGEKVGNIRLFDVAKLCQETGIYKFSVAACPAEGSTDYSMSAYSDELEIVRLGTAQKIRITETSPLNPAGEILITLVGVREGAKYVATLNGSQIGATNGNTFTISKPLSTYVVPEAGYTSLKLEIRAYAESVNPTNNKLYLDAIDKMEIQLNQLEAPQHLAYEKINGIDYVKWDAASENTTGYGLLFGSDLRTCTDNKFEIPDLAAGSYTVCVFAQGDILKDWKDGSFQMFSDTTYNKELDYEKGLALWLTSPYSSALTIKKLATPTNITINKANSNITWDSVIDVVGGYQINAYPVNGNKMPYTTEESNNGIYGINTASLNLYGDELKDVAVKKGIALEIIAKGNTDLQLGMTDNIILDSNPTKINNNTIYRWLPKIELKIQDLNLNWEPVNNASGYILKNAIANTEYATVNGTSFAWTDANNFQAGTYTVSIVAIANTSNTYFDSIESDPITFTKLQVPVLHHLFVDGQFDNKNYYIEAEEGCLEYKIITSAANGVNANTQYLKVKDMQPVVVDGKTYYRYTPEFNNLENPTITVQAMGNGELKADSTCYMASNVYKYTQITRKMEAPINPSIIAKTVMDGDVAKLQIKSDAVNPVGGKYVFYLNNVPLAPQEAPEYNDYVPSQGSSVRITIGFEGKVFVQEGNDYIYYYDSGYSETAITISFLSKVSNVSATTSTADNNVDRIYHVKWSAVSNALYFYEYRILDGETVVYESAKIDSENRLSAGSTNQTDIIVPEEYLGKGYKIEVKIYTIGNDYASGEGTIITNTTPTEYTSVIQ